MNKPKTNFTGPQLCVLQAHEAVDLLKRREISPSELLDAAYQRIGQVEPAINAMVTRCEERAHKAAENLGVDRGDPGWLAGLPIGVKDLSAVAGVRSTSGTRGLKDFVPQTSSDIVLQMERNGAIVAGKTNTPEQGAGGNTFNDVFGRTRNPWNIHRNAGGSSGGAAASLATGEVWLSHGSDLAGSLRTPACYCGIVGLRPTPGRAGGAGPDTAFNIESVQGPMARTVRDTALFLDAMCGFIPASPISIEAPKTPFQQAVLQADTDVSIAWAGDLNGLSPITGEVDAILRGSLERASAAGVRVAEECPKLPNLYDTYITLRAMVWAAGPGRLPEAVQKHFKPTLRENIELGQRLTADQIYDAQRNRSQLFATMRTFFERHDVLACPVVGLAPGPVEQEYPTELDGKPLTDYVDWLRFSFLATTTALPSISLPVGFTDQAMPMGIQLIGPPRGEAKLLKVAKTLEQICDVALKTPIDPFDPDGEPT